MDEDNVSPLGGRPDGPVVGRATVGGQPAPDQADVDRVDDRPPPARAIYRAGELSPPAPAAEPPPTLWPIPTSWPLPPVEPERDDPVPADEYAGPAQTYAEPAQTYAGPARAYAEPARAYAEPDADGPDADGPEADGPDADGPNAGGDAVQHVLPVVAAAAPWDAFAIPAPGSQGVADADEPPPELPRRIPSPRFDSARASASVPTSSRVDADDLVPPAQIAASSRVYRAGTVAPGEPTRPAVVSTQYRPFAPSAVPFPATPATGAEPPRPTEPPQPQEPPEPAEPPAPPEPPQPAEPPAPPEPPQPAEPPAPPTPAPPPYPPQPGPPQPTPPQPGPPQPGPPQPGPPQPGPPQPGPPQPTPPPGPVPPEPAPHPVGPPPQPVPPGPEPVPQPPGPGPQPGPPYPPNPPGPPSPPPGPPAPPPGPPSPPGPIPAPPFPPPPPSMAWANERGVPSAGRESTGTHPANQAPPNAAPIVPSAEYGQWARNQRPPGTVYGGPGQRGHAPAGGGASAENSGSLTGHILAQGSADVAEPRDHAKVIMVMTLITAALIAVGVVVSGLVGR
jgi:hypothetical protein